MALDEDFYGLGLGEDTPAEALVAPKRPARVLCKSLSDPSSIFGEDADSPDAAGETEDTQWPWPCVGDLRTTCLWKAIQAYHHCIPKDF